jgi:hypothetical protein
LQDQTEGGQTKNTTLNGQANMHIEDLKLVIEMEGGLIVSISSNYEIPMAIYVRDLDLEGADEESIITTQRGFEFYGQQILTDFNPAYIKDTLSAFKEISNYEP